MATILPDNCSNSIGKLHMGFAMSLACDLFPQMIPRDAFSLSEVPSEHENDDFSVCNEFDVVWSGIIEPTPFQHGTSLKVSPCRGKQSMIQSQDTFSPSLLKSSLQQQNTTVAARKPNRNKRNLEISAFAWQSNKRARINENEGQKHRPTIYPHEKNQTPRFREYQDAQWEDQFESLLKYKQQYGNCNVPHTFELDPALSRWVKRQRYQYRQKREGKRTSMSPERQQKLQNVGFVWDPHAALWEARRAELVEYKQKFGNCNVPSRYSQNPQLGMWVRSQRREYNSLRNGKMSRLTPERYRMLDTMGFVWDPRAAVFK